MEMNIKSLSNDYLEKNNKSKELTMLVEKNKLFQESFMNNGNISKNLRENLVKNGQNPYAVIISCSDSRVVPEHIFMAGIGELFTVRNAGNIISEVELASVLYAVSHLGSKIILVLGHTCCGAVNATVNCSASGMMLHITDKISKAIGSEKDSNKAEILNMKYQMNALMENQEIANGVKSGEFDLVGGIYDTHSGNVSFYVFENADENLVLN